jgi:hypothetical protein
MKWEAAVQLKADVVRTFDREVLGVNKAAKFHSVNEVRKDRRLAIGIARGPRGYQLEVRQQRDGHPLAEKLKQEYKGRINVEVVQDVRIPPLGTNFPKAFQGALLEGDDMSAANLRIGLSIGHLQGGAGTLAAFLSIGDADYVLSCNHVLALLNKATLGDPIYHPGKPSKRMLGPRNRVATLHNWAELLEDDSNPGDCAIALLNKGIDHAGNVIPDGCIDAGKKIQLLGDVKHIDTNLGLLKHRQRVRKIGRTTGETEGEVSAIGLERFSVSCGTRNFEFYDVIEVESLKKPFSAPGDSGSLVYTDSRKAIGIVFAGGYKLKDDKKVAVSYVCRLDRILDYFRAKLTE